MLETIVLELSDQEYVFRNVLVGETNGFESE